MKSIVKASLVAMFVGFGITAVAAQPLWARQGSPVAGATGFLVAHEIGSDRPNAPVISQADAIA